jgi:hypothetical protein
MRKLARSRQKQVSPLLNGAMHLLFENLAQFLPGERTSGTHFSL